MEKTKIQQESCPGKAEFSPVSSLVCCQETEDGKPVRCVTDNFYTAAKDCTNRAKQDKTWSGETCYCCCSCFARGTPIATPSGNQAIETLAEGALVLAAQPSASAPGGLVWEPTKVTFSSGTTQGTSPSVVYLAFHEDEDQPRDLICSTDQVFMLADGKLIRAARLHRGDRLITKDGNPVQIHTIAIGEYNGGVHHIGTAAFDDLTGQHLIVAGGVVAGDYYLQLNFDRLDDEHKVADHAQRPDIWSAAYQEQHAVGNDTQTRMIFGYGPADRPDAALVAQTGLFTVYGAGEEPYGDLVAALFTAEQAADVRKNGQQVRFNNPIPQDEVQNIFRRLAGFYPDIEFYLDWERMEPNAYAVRKFGRKFVIVTGGLARLKELSYNGLFLCVAHAIARFSGIKPIGQDGFSGAGAADWGAFVGVRANFWWANTGPKVLDLYNEYESLFKLIDPAHAGGDPNDPINHPSVECRLGCVSAAIFGGPVGECAGGDAPIKVALEEAQATSDTRIVLTLNERVTAESAAVTGNYVLTPAAEITKAELDGQPLPCRVTLTTQLDKGKTYSVKIHGLESLMFSASVDPEHDTKQFTSPN
nr:Hint domain-containing protein [Nonomuraea sp. MG754425]